jgi:hypothetical protein
MPAFPIAPSTVGAAWSPVLTPIGVRGVCPISMTRHALNHAAPTGLDDLWCGVIYKHVAPDGVGIRLGLVLYKHAVHTVDT